MHRLSQGIPLLVLFLAASGSAQAAGLLVPEDKKIPPLAMVHHRVSVAIDDQVAITTVEQSFRNHTDRALEATYIFPVPRGASVDHFAMWIDDKEVSGELLDSKKASQVYTDIVRRTMDPGLLEYIGNDMLRLRVFPVQPRKDQKIKVSFKSIAPLDAGVVEYLYPLKTDGVANRTLEDFSVKVSLKSQKPIQNIYSPTHAISIIRKSDHEAAIDFERNQALLDKDFQLFYGFGAQDIGVTPLLYKPITSEDGYFMILISPQMEMANKRVPRDLVMVLDTSSSMSELKMQQAKKALKYCLGQLTPQDRFAIIKFSTSVHNFRDTLVEASPDYLKRANKWVSDLQTSGGTAIWPALDQALGMRTADSSRPFTMVFFTDGMPTVDETNPDKIVKNVVAKTSGNVRIFTFGVGDDVNAAMLDQLADATRAVSTYVRPAEDIEAKVASLYSKINHPVLTDVRLTTDGNVKLNEIYPPRLPDLFHGTQLVVIGRYSGNGFSSVKLSGMVGSERKEFTYEVNFKERTDSGKDFVEPLWGRRKVGYLLDQIRANGENKELVQEVVSLAKRYGIATPYTSYLVVPDGPMPVVPHRPTPGRGPIGSAAPGGFGGIGGGGIGGGAFPYSGGIGGGGFAGGGRPGVGGAPMSSPAKVEDFAKGVATKPGTPSLEANRGALAERETAEAMSRLKGDKDAKGVVEELRKFQEQKKVFDQANTHLRAKNKDGYQTGQLGVDLSLASNGLRNQDRLSMTANRQAAGRNCLEIGGVWIDEAFKADMKTVVVKAQSDAYFQILAKHPDLKDLYRLGNYLVWVAPSGTALVVDAGDGKEQLPASDIEALFAAKK